MSSATSSVADWRPEDPTCLPPAGPPGSGWLQRRATRLVSNGDRKRFRFGVLVRAGLVSPHITIIQLLWIPATLALVLAWFCALLAGRVPVALHRFLAWVVRYETRVAAYALSLADPFPGFTSRTTYPFDISFEAGRRHSRLRALLYLPIVAVLLVIATPAIVVILLLAPIGWLWAIVFGRMPRWVQSVNTRMVCFISQSAAFGLLATDRWPSRASRIVSFAEWTPTPLPDPREQHERSERSRIVTLGGLALLTIGTVAGGVLLWHTTVPGDLKAPTLNASRYFSASDISRTTDAQNTSNGWFVAATFASIAGLALFAWRGRRLVRFSAAGPIGTGIFIGMLGLAWATLVSAPFLVLALESLPDTVDVGPVGLEVPLTALGQMTNATIVLAIVMGIARKLPRGWWLAATPALGVLLVGAVLISPALESNGTKLDDPVLLADAHRLAAREGIPDVHIDYIDDRDDGTDTPTPTNAFAVGNGSSADVVIQGSLRSRRELRVMLGHEIAHVARKHSWRSAGWQLLFLLIGAAVVQLAIRRRGDLYNPALVPLALLAFSVAHLALTPLNTAASRRYEAEADWIALGATQDPEGDIRLMKVLAADNEAAPADPWWTKALIDDHPDILSRIEMAVAWERRHPGSRPLG